MVTNDDKNLRDIPVKDNIPIPDGNGDNSDRPGRKKRFRDRSLGAKTAIVALWTAGAFLLSAVILLCVATWWLTPERLTGIVNREASKALRADVRAYDIRFTLWSSWPRFCIEYDSLRIDSRTLRNLDSATRAQLPANPDFLASTGSFRGGINLLALLRGKISLYDVSIDSPALNLVTVSDSLNNFVIWTPGKENLKIPYFTANSLKITHPQPIKWFSLPDSAMVNVDLGKVEVKRHKRSDNRYSLDIRGKAGTVIDSLRLLEAFPFRLDGDVDLRFHPFAVSMRNCSVRLGEIDGNVDMNLKMEDNVSIEVFNYRLPAFNIRNLMSCIPPGLLPELDGLDGLDADLRVSADARLTSPYNLTTGRLPSAKVELQVIDGKLRITTADGRSVTVNHSGAHGILTFDGEHPDSSDFVLEPFRLEGEGTDMTVGGVVKDLLGKPAVTASLNGNASLTNLSCLIPALRENALKGDLIADAIMNFHLRNLSTPDIRDLRMRGNVGLRKFSAVLPGKKGSASAGRIDLHFGGDAEDIDSRGLEDALFNLHGSGKDISVKMAGNTMKASEFTLDSQITEAGHTAFGDPSAGIPLDVNVSTVGLTLDNPSDTLHAEIEGIDLRSRLATDKAGIVPASFRVKGKSGSMRLHSAGKDVNLSGVDFLFDACREKHPVAVADYTVPEKWRADSLSMGFVRHSPEYLQVKLSKAAKNLISRWKAFASLRVRKGEILAPGFPVRNVISDLDMSASADSVVVRSLALRSLSTGMRMSGKVENLRQFLFSSTPAPVRVKMDIALDTVQINQLAAAYERGRHITGKPVSTADTVTGSDTVAMLIPRNISADIRASAMQTRYMNLHLYDLSTGLKLNDGNLDVDSLRISADFGRAELDLSYLSQDIQRLGIKARLGIRQVEVVEFFKNFHTLLLMMPEMSNISGVLSAECEAKMLAFPDMYVNVPSVWADLYVHGRELKVRQSPFIRKITRMMLIGDSGTLRIANMNVHASIHDNLLELYPFDFEFDRYRLRMGGLNNFDGKLYYHIGIEKSPVPFPFGINIVGWFHDPEIRFGGATYKVKKGSEITASVMEDNQVNIISEARKYIREFIEKAAEADNTPESSYVY